MSSNVIENLVNEAKKGNSDSFGRLYEFYARDMFRFAYFYTSSQALAEDCVSEAVMTAFKKIGQVKNSSSFKSWLFKILHNCCVASYRKNEKEITVEEIFESHISENSDTDVKLSLKAALLKLSDEEREIIILYYCCGYTSKEIGEIMSLKDATVRSKILRGMEKLKKELL
ncbi:MAG: RNA polymerase sigma factor [Acutalibacteraceae bacterium]